MTIVTLSKIMTLSIYLVSGSRMDMEDINVIIVLTSPHIHASLNVKLLVHCVVTTTDELEN